MKHRINSYFAVLIITVFGAAATQIILHAVYQTTYPVYAGDIYTIVP